RAHRFGEGRLGVGGGDAVDVHLVERLVGMASGAVGGRRRNGGGQLLQAPARRRRQLVGRELGAGRDAGQAAAADDRDVHLSTPTVVHSSVTARSTSPPNSSRATSTVAVAASANCESAASRSVSVTYQTRPTVSHAKPPTAVAARYKAWFGMPELMWTP